MGEDEGAFDRTHSPHNCILSYNLINLYILLPSLGIHRGRSLRYFPLFYCFSGDLSPSVRDCGAVCQIR
ncbi:MAG: hypothetical protein EWV83_00440 [Microcystis sp. M_OC_Ca_00000000_S217Cul]|nr:MAG: hypothetical protein EWV83_00440 [Microcystis sp. M_OC_Ca_00000000_S217Cul]TRT86805.1 MAG: hypothetical protein EWV66_15505 [Microcystis sp. M_OC_Ca_00000000_C217Col]